MTAARMTCSQLMRVNMVTKGTPMSPTVHGPREEMRRPSPTYGTTIANQVRTTTSTERTAQSIAGRRSGARNAGSRIAMRMVSLRRLRLSVSSSHSHRESTVKSVHTYKERGSRDQIRAPVVCWATSGDTVPHTESKKMESETPTLGIVMMSACCQKEALYGNSLRRTFCCLVALSENRGTRRAPLRKRLLYKAAPVRRGLRRE